MCIVFGNMTCAITLFFFKKEKKDGVIRGVGSQRISLHYHDTVELEK